MCVSVFNCTFSAVPVPKNAKEKNGHFWSLSNSTPSQEGPVNNDLEVLA
jgi:hypothetical protein